MSSVNDYHSRSKGVFIVTTIAFVLATIFVAARLISRFGILRNRTADDWCIILAWVSAGDAKWTSDRLPKKNCTDVWIYS
jgi:hypothetical protein